MVTKAFDSSNLKTKISPEYAQSASKAEMEKWKTCLEAITKLKTKDPSLNSEKEMLKWKTCLEAITKLKTKDPSLNSEKEMLKNILSYQAYIKTIEFLTKL